MSRDRMSSPGYNSPTPRRKAQEKDELSTQFERSVSLVRAYTNRFEHDIARPALNLSGELFDERPITATFLAILLLLTFFPVISFFGVTVFTIVSFLSIAVIASLSAAAVVIIGLFAILIVILLASACTSAFLTSTAIGTYVLFRLVSLVRQNGVTAGISDWTEEVWGHILRITSKNGEITANWNDPDDARSESTNNSTVLVRGLEDPSPENHDEIYSSTSDSDVKVQG